MGRRHIVAVSGIDAGRAAGGAQPRNAGVRQRAAPRRAAPNMTSSTRSEVFGLTRSIFNASSPDRPRQSAGRGPRFRRCRGRLGRRRSRWPPRRPGGHREERADLSRRKEPSHEDADERQERTLHASRPGRMNLEKNSQETQPLAILELTEGSLLMLFI